jgi:thiamine biosynthesis lipoprotein
VGIDARGVSRFSCAAMAAQFEILCGREDEAPTAPAARQAFAVVERLEQELSRFIENSDITRINHLAAGEWTRVSACTMECLQIAAFLQDETGGAFDISLGSGLKRLELSPGEFAVRVNAGGIRLDLGGIGKGYAVDRIAEVLEEWDLDRALIHSGFSSVLALEGPPGSEGWPLDLSIPGGARAIRIQARNRCISASGSRKGDHILDPRSGQPVRRRIAAWAAAPRDVLAELSRQALAASCAANAPIGEMQASPSAIADALSTAFMILPIREIGEFCLKHRGVEAWIVHCDEGPGKPSPAVTHVPSG